MCVRCDYYGDARECFLAPLAQKKPVCFISLLRNDAAVVGTMCGLHSWNVCHIVSCCCCQLLFWASGASRCSSTSGGQVGRGTWGSAMSPRHSSHIVGPKVGVHRPDSPALEKVNTGGSLSVRINACSIKMWQFISAVTTQMTWFITTNCSFLVPNDSQLYMIAAPHPQGDELSETIHHCHQRNRNVWMFNYVKGC